MALRFPPCMAFPLPFPFPPTIRSNPSSLLPSSPLTFSFIPLRSLPSHASPVPDAAADPVTTSAASPAPPTHVFLPHLELDAAEEDVEEEEAAVKVTPLEEGGRAEGLGGQEDGGEEDPDPIRSFFESKLSVPDPKHEGRTSLQKNRRTSWRIAGAAGIGAEDEELEKIELGLELGCQTPSSTGDDEGVVGEILKIARGIPENSTLGETLGPFAGRVGEGDCIQLLVRMGEECLISECLYLFEWMGLQEPSLVTPRSCSVLFPVLGRAGKGKELMTLFGQLPRAKRFRDVHVYNAAISGLACCGRYDEAWKVYETMETNNVLPDNVTCSILITTMRKNGCSSKDVWQFFEHMSRKGVKLRLEAFGALIKSFCDEGLKKEALAIQSEMEKKGISSNTVIYNTLMNAYVKSNQVEEAEGLFFEMKEKGLKPTMATYNILMDAYSRRMQPEIIEDLLMEMHSLGLKPNVKSYTCLISAYGRQRKLSDMAADAFLRMKKVGIKPTSHSYTALIHAYSVGGWHEKALAAFESMKREGIMPCIETYTALLDAFRRAGNTEKLMVIWKSMINDKIEGTRVTFNIVLDGLAKNGLYVHARDVISEFGRIGIQPTVMTYNMLMNAYARGGQHYKLPQLLKEMAALNLKPDSITYMTMIYAYVRVRDFSKAFFYHKQMVKNGQVPDAKSYQKLRAILDVKAAVKNRRDKSALLGIINSNMGLLKYKKGKKDEFWKYRKKRSVANKDEGS
uniref:Pentatricopeptide repeat-containing protein At5g50280, chloroplastic n=1 Tax=Anthurium amnicola TaxID=1678845 RepID=A0A1D1YGJ6_9ARAE